MPPAVRTPTIYPMGRARTGASTKPKPTRKREKQITLWVSEAEYAAFRGRADATDQPLTSWIRRVCRGAVGMETV